MPFKTKRRKLAAAKHRVLINESGVVSWNRLDSPGPARKKVKASYAIDEVGLLSLPEVKRELTHIVLLASIIMGLQLALKLTNLPFLS